MNLTGPFTAVTRAPWRRMALAAALAGAALLAVAGAAEACPMCKDALIEPGAVAQRVGTAKGYALSIAVLLAVPYALIGGIGMLLVRSARRRHGGQAS
ncbi:MAG TPA: hypothetical protein VGB20_01765 [bacterium]